MDNNMDNKEMDYAKFRWERQKFTLVLAVAVMAMTLSITAFFYQSQQRLRVEEYSSEVAMRTLRDYKELEIETKILQQKVLNLEDKIKSNESLIKSVLENQKAQESVLKTITERSQ